ncbi:hypothetical protein BGZ80_010684 [Entomortierella chlamydospora]|uniref:P-loop containing nucleoside triphosphate hydrolase protein n=1 Tax=Entomortierella chlamydospora TaxID=101097 RepID=A0A9P6T067_9FUNG|nr:hypothetical protein BGZ80_010684 [Entomortierella chlamydospora]
MKFCDAEGWTVFSQSRAMDFTLCFQDSVLTLIPNVILLVFLTPRIHKVVGKGRLEGIKAGALFHFKMLFVLASATIQLAILIKVVSESNYRSSALLSTILYLVGLIGAAALYWFEYFNIANPSVSLLVFWLVTALISIFPTRSWIQASQDGLSSPLALLKLLFTIVSFLIFTLENIPKSNRTSLTRHNAITIDQKNPSPETRSNYFARVSFFWLVPLLKQGKKRALRMDDLYSLHPKLLSYPLYLTTKAKIDAEEAIAIQRIKDDEERGVSNEGSKTKKGHINLFGTVLHTVGYSFLAAVFPRILYICTYYIRPVLFSSLIDFISTYSATSIAQGEQQAPWIGFGLLIAGINLSGGQKQRISIGRAVYANADVYIFDDPLSAVDAHVDEHIFKNVFQSILAEKTRILITNGANHLKDADQIVVIKQGRISEDGQYTDLMQNKKGDLFRLVKESEITVSKEEGGKKLSLSGNGSSEDDRSGDGEGASTESSGDEGTVDAESDEPRLAKRPSFKRSKSSRIKGDGDIELDELDEVDEEIVAKGNVGWPVYKYYLSSIGTASMIFISFVLVIYVGIKVGIQLWQGRWGNANDKLAAGSAQEHPENYWIMTYFAWVISGTLVLALVSSIFLIFLARRASMKLHSAMLAPLVRSPMSFFDVTSSGKIVNRFAHDVTAIDIQLPFVFLQLITMIFNALNIFGMCIAASPYFVIIMIPLGFGYYQLGGFYLVSSRELKRLDSAARSPLYAHFGETLAGLTTIRAFNDSSRFAVQATTLLDRSQQTSYLTNVSTRWLQIMLDFLSLIVLTAVGLLAILQRESANQQVFSIVLSQIGQLTAIMTQILSCSVNLETTIVSVERAREYSQLTPEARDVIPDSKTDEAWPQRGQIVFNQYSTRYREGMDLVLKGVNVIINGGERVGIVGRTGAGKSSVTMALFRIIEAAEGSIQIDGTDISTLGLHELRSHLTIIPQDPFLFGDSIRVNLDPFNKHTDTEIWAALESASLKSYVKTLPEGISTTIDNGGENMSLGQRQLLSLARAMLSQNTHVLCLDEATAAIDVETDNAIQLALRREFSGCTVLTIAHRINTIMDNDRILVLEQGQVVEYDTPQNLLQKKDSIFYSLAAKSGNAK